MGRRASRIFQPNDPIWVAHRPKRPAIVHQWLPPTRAANDFPNGVIGAAEPPYIDGVVEVRFVELDAFGREYPKEVVAGTSVERSIDRITKSSNLTVAPGSFVLKIAEFVCTKKVYDRVFFQVVDDMRREYFEALFSGRKERARWVVIRGYLALAWHVTLQVSEFLVSGPAKIMKALWT